MFAQKLDGHPLISNKSVWRSFPWLRNDRWHVGNMVLVGDALHTAHFSIGSGTRLAMEDVIALVKALEAEDDIEQALARYETLRRPVVTALVEAAKASGEWYEQFPARMNLAPTDFAYSYITRSGRIDDDRLRAMSPRFMERLNGAHQTAAGARHGGSTMMPGRRPDGLIDDAVPADCSATREINFNIPERYNASELLFQNTANGLDDRPAVIGPAGRRTYAELCADAGRWGNAFLSLGLVRGDRVLLFLDDTPAYPAAFFGAVRAGFVPLLINLQTPPDLLQFYLSNSGAKVAVAEASCSEIDLTHQPARTRSLSS